MSVLVKILFSSDTGQDGAYILVSYAGYQKIYPVFVVVPCGLLKQCSVLKRIAVP